MAIRTMSRLAVCCRPALLLGLAAVLSGSTLAGEPPEPSTFDPGAWLRQHKLGRLTTRTPQSGKALQPLSATTLQEWEKERRLYAAALRELIGPWPRKRPELAARVLAKDAFPKYARYKVGFRSVS